MKKKCCSYITKYFAITQMHAILLLLFFKKGKETSGILLINSNSNGKKNYLCLKKQSYVG